MPPLILSTKPGNSILIVTNNLPITLIIILSAKQYNAAITIAIAPAAMPIYLPLPSRPNTATASTRVGKGRS